MSGGGVILHNKKGKVGEVFKFLDLTMTNITYITHKKKAICTL
jgi:hypothetical protein